MSTKNNPGPFDCYAKLDPDEPHFVLRGRDVNAGALVREWAAWRELGGEDSAVVAEALRCADDMDAWAESLGRVPRPVPGRHGIAEHIVELARLIVTAWTDEAVDRTVAMRQLLPRLIDSFEKLGAEDEARVEKLVGDGCLCVRVVSGKQPRQLAARELGPRCEGRPIPLSRLLEAGFALPPGGGSFSRGHPRCTCGRKAIGLTDAELARVK